MSINKVILLGRLTQDPAIRTFENGGKVAQFSLATNKRAYTTRDGREIPEQTEFHSIVINRKGLADVAEKYLKKGNQLYLEGELRTREYTDNNGNKRWFTEVYVAEMELLTPKQGGGSIPAPAPVDDPNDPANW